MSIRVFVAAASLSLLAVSCSCGRDDAAELTRVDDRATQGAPRPAATADPDAAREAAALAAVEAQRATAMHGAVDVVQRYLARLGGADWKSADALWAYRRQPAPSEEAGLRALLPARAMRIENGAPRALDDEPVPAYVEVPVTLRIDTADAGAQRYRGWYRVRWNAVQQEWELTAASVAPEIR